MDINKLKKVLMWYDLGVDHKSGEFVLTDTATGNKWFNNPDLEVLINYAFTNVVEILEPELPF